MVIFLFFVDLVVAWARSNKKCFNNFLFPLFYFYLTIICIAKNKKKIKLVILIVLKRVSKILQKYKYKAFTSLILKYMKNLLFSLKKLESNIVFTIIQPDSLNWKLLPTLKFLIKWSYMFNTNYNTILHISKILLFLNTL